MPTATQARKVVGGASMKATIDHPQLSVSILNINPGQVYLEYVESLLAIKDPGPHTKPTNVLHKRTGGLIQMGRNELMVQWLNETETEWALWIDSDIQFPVDTIDHLYEIHKLSGSPVVGANYVHPLAGGYKPSVFYYDPKDTNGIVEKHMTPVTMQTFQSQRDSGAKFLYVDGTGAGCLMINRALATEMATVAAQHNDPDPWFTVRAFHNVLYGEDLAFCHRVRTMGYTIAVSTTLKLGHVKSVIFYPPEAES